jgi:ribosomal protein S18 acetylase RimI-like enzyme
MTSTTQIVQVRPLRSDDTEAVETVFADLSDRSRYLRFDSPVPCLSGSMRRMLLDVDEGDRLALLAQAQTSNGCEPVGIARLIRTGPGEAEIAVAVVDAWQRRGVGRMLLTAVQAAAAERKIDRLSAFVLAENHAAQRLIRAVFPRSTSSPDGATVHMTCPVRHDTVANTNIAA